MEANRRCFVVEEGPNPSTDYFVIPFLREKGMIAVRCAFGDLPAADSLEGAAILFVRYVPRNWKALVDRCRGKIASLCFFMDDDLFDRRAFASMRPAYQWKLLRLSWSRQRWLRSMGAQMLVSSPYLQQKYAHWQPQMLTPRPVAPLDQPPLVTVFYHGSASHGADIRWLRPVMEEVLARNENLAFELIGDAAVNRAFKSLPRTHVLHPMKWPSYQALIRRPCHSIGLAPLLDLPFNRARSHTKFFDITQAGAVGVYAQGPVYDGVVQHERNGLMVPMEQRAWIDAILRLAEDEALRSRLLEGAWACL